MGKDKGKKASYIRLFLDLMEQTPDVIYFKDRQGRLTYVNHAHARGLGLKPEEVVGKTDFDIFPKHRAEAMSKDDRLVMERAVPIVDKIERSTRADGFDNYVSTTKIPRLDKAGRVIGLIGITRDITRRMHLKSSQEEKARLEKRIAALEELNKLKLEFISVVSHELRTPLAIVKEAVNLITDGIIGGINQKQKEVLQKANANIERLNGLIEDLLDMARIEKGTLKLRYSLVNLNDLLKESTEFFKRRCEEKGLALEYALPEKGINIFVDPERINQVVANLLGNAVKFTEPGGEVKLEMKLLESKVRIGVIDTGIGIAKPDLQRIFGKFIQSGAGAGGQKKGLGLGLAIVKEMVERHSGEAWAESRLGVGSKFYFTLPRFAPVDFLAPREREKINSFLAAGRKVHFINLSIVNSRKFRQKSRLTSAKFFSAFRENILAALGEASRPLEGGQGMILADTRGRNPSIIIPDADEKVVHTFCQALKDKINGYFSRRGIKNIFVSLGVLPYPQKPKPAVPRELPANLLIKEMYIGAEMRALARLSYRAEVDILLKDKVTFSQTVDITRAGVCFYYRSPLETDAPIKIKLKLPFRARPLLIQGRIAWIGQNSAEAGSEAEGYKVGVEFIKLGKENKKILSQFILKISKQGGVDG